MFYAVYQKAKNKKNYNNNTINYNQPQDLIDWVFSYNFAPLDLTLGDNIIFAVLYW